MFIRLSHRVVPVVMLVLLGLWISVVFGTLILYLLFPVEDFGHIISAFQGREILRKEFFIVQKQVFDSSGFLRRAIPVAAFYGGSVEYKRSEWHTSTKVKISYLAWFER